jgi:hypothetical protein
LPICLYHWHNEWESKLGSLAVAPAKQLEAYGNCKRAANVPQSKNTARAK